MTRAVAAAVLCICCVAAVYRPVHAMTQVSPAATFENKKAGWIAPAGPSNC